MPGAPPPEPRRFSTPDGASWEARLLPQGRPSPYLARRLDRPVVEFRRVTPPEARTYASLPGPALSALDGEALVALWRRARPY